MYHRLLHVPGVCGTPFCAESTVKTDIFVFNHDSARFEMSRHIKILLEICCGSHEGGAHRIFLGIVDEANAVHRAYIHTGIALDAKLVRENGLHIAI